MHLFIKSSIRCTFSLKVHFFYNFWHSFGARVWDIFSISGNALMNHFFSIVISCKKAKNGFCEVLRIRCTFSLKVQFFHNFWHSFGARVWDIFSISGNALMNHFFSIVISCKKAKNASVRFCWSDAPFRSIFYSFWHSFGARVWDILSIWGNALMNHFFSIVNLAKRRKTILWGFADLTHFH